MSHDLIQLAVENNGQRHLITTRRNATIAELNLQAVEIVFTGVLSSDDFYLTWGGRTLDNESETVKNLNIPDKAQIGVFLRLHGRSNRSLKPLPGYISTTSLEPCCFSLNDDPHETRAKMPCKCVISVESMTDYFNSELKSGKFRFSCPNCKRNEWQYFLIRHVLSAKMNEEGLKNIDAKVNENFVKSPDMQHCPFCGSNCKRDLSKKFLNKHRVVCPLCSKRSGRDVEFCWCCLKSWKGNMESCGNAECDGTDPRCRFLIGCPTKTIGDNVNVPSVRACVKCGNLIYHNDKCKHMTCGCGYAFCFVCLKPYNKNTKTWACVGYYNECPVAPRQKHLDETPGYVQSSSDDSKRCIIT